MEPREGARCFAAAFQIPRERSEKALRDLRKREGVFLELRELDILVPDLGTLKALAPVQRHDATSRIMNATPENLAGMVRSAKETNGACLEYVENIRMKLQELGISDVAVETLADLADR